MLSSSYLLACDTVLLTRKFYEVIPINSFWIIELIEYYFSFFGHVMWHVDLSSLARVEPVPPAGNSPEQDFLMGISLGRLSYVKLISSFPTKIVQIIPISWHLHPCEIPSPWWAGHITCANQYNKGDRMSLPWLHFFGDLLAGSEEAGCHVINCLWRGPFCKERPTARKELRFSGKQAGKEMNSANNHIRLKVHPYQLSFQMRLQPWLTSWLKPCERSWSK